MKYFKKELWQGINQRDKEINRKSNAELDLNFKLYAENLNLINPKLSKNAYKLIFNDKGEASCPDSGERYLLKDKKVHIVK